MPRSGTLGNPQPYTPFGVFAGLPFWGGGLTLLAAAPGIGKTSWLLRMIFESSSLHIPSAIGCYEHTPEELRFTPVHNQIACCYNQGINLFY